jgi:NAD(P)-dependent dehydrogenase (short-subunit alcohol dehydrogenase family)
MANEQVALVIAGGRPRGADAARRLVEHGYRVGVMSSSTTGTSGSTATS